MIYLYHHLMMELEAKADIHNKINERVFITI
jgi:hypothetical protein